MRIPGGEGEEPGGAEGREGVCGELGNFFFFSGSEMSPENLFEVLLPCNAKNRTCKVKISRRNVNFALVLKGIRFGGGGL